MPLTSQLRAGLRRILRTDPLSGDVEWYAEAAPSPRAIIQVSPGVQGNSMFVNYGDQLMFWAIEEALIKRSYSVLRVPRVALSGRQLKRQRPDIFLDLGGFIYSGLHHKGMKSIQAADATWRNARACRRAGAFVVSAPQTFGPFPGGDDDLLAQSVRRMVTEFDAIYVRDVLSLSHLRELSPGLEAKVRIAPDIAFLWEADPAAGRDVLARAGVDTTRPVAGIIPNRQISQRDDTYLDVMAEVIRFLRDAGAEVVVIPHERGRYGKNERDDIYLCRLLAQRTGAASLALPKSDTPPPAEEEARYIREVEAAIGALDFLVSGRFHGALSGLAQGVPTVAYAWAHKYPPLFADLGLSPEECILGGHGAAATSAGMALERLAAAWQRRAATRAVLGRTVPEVRARINRLVEDVDIESR
jgi:polysaccharide pyruvyl transferase WcaK-like protein